MDRGKRTDPRGGNLGIGAGTEPIAEVGRSDLARTRGCIGGPTRGRVGRPRAKHPWPSGHRRLGRIYRNQRFLKEAQQLRTPLGEVS